MELKLRAQRQYGRDYFYPVSDLANAICEVLKRKTLTEAQLEIFKQHNVEVTIDDNR